MDDESQDVMVKSLHFEDGRINLTASHPGFAIMADEAAKVFKEFGGENYLSMIMCSEEYGPLEIIIQRVGKIRPAEKAGMLQKLVDAYRAKRSVDGLNGRTWNARVHLEAEELVANLEATASLPRPDAL